MSKVLANGPYTRRSVEEKQNRHRRYTETERHTGSKQNRHRDSNASQSSLFLVKRILPAAYIAKCHIHLLFSRNNVYSAFRFRLVLPIVDHFGLKHFNRQRTCKHEVGEDFLSAKCMSQCRILTLIR